METYAQWIRRVAGDIPESEVRVSGYSAGINGLVWAEAIHLPTGRLLGKWSRTEEKPDAKTE